jgi:hypothetical protein
MIAPEENLPLFMITGMRSDCPSRFRWFACPHLHGKFSPAANDVLFFLFIVHLGGLLTYLSKPFFATDQNACRRQGCKPVGDVLLGSHMLAPIRLILIVPFRGFILSNKMIRNFGDHSANERTFLAWVRTAIAVMAFGFLVEKFDLFGACRSALSRSHSVVARAEIRQHSGTGACRSRHCDGSALQLLAL